MLAELLNMNTRLDEEFQKAKITTFRYYLAILTGLFILALALDIVIDFQNVSGWVFVTSALISAVMLMLSMWNIHHATLLTLNIIGLLIVSEFEIYFNPNAYHVVVYWMGITPLLVAVLMRVKETIFWTFVISLFIIINGLYVHSLFPTYELTIYPFRFLAGGSLFALMTALVAILFSYSQQIAQKRLAEQNLKLQSLTKEISLNNLNLEKRVADRTAALEIQNQKLTEYAFINSHQLRGPLSRILGLINVLNSSPLSDTEKEIIQHLKSAGHDLDEVIAKINRTLDNGHTLDRNALDKPEKQDS